ncbi:MAG: polynucleotide adenylyltransferase PcnB [Deltaproteobacteria bacterium]|nr:polynucleotide adenylyltransferase PcnB [Deltaproteobacteria bacterium]MBK8718231.1 polynucleotide adenylyltransferase PcnB [Deltaproteobacteria bacterium]MBP7289017.1 polynucleotide adenylyltransferase PcnB [Nannocystaceae bacterium]
MAGSQDLPSETPDTHDGATPALAATEPSPGTGILMEAIDPDALKVVRRLLTAGHEAYLVGGCVRDLYLARRPKDFDIATSATPEAIRRLFRNSRIIGRRFKLAHVFFGSKIIETSTFRTAPQPSEADDPLITADNEWGSVEDDARRRDFTINGLFFDVETEKIVDFVDGLTDLDAKLMRTIGDPRLRFQEDPVRMIRAVKFAARLGFDFEAETYAALLEVAPDIVKCSKARVLEEIYKLLRSGSARRSFELMLEVGLFEHVLGPYLRQFGEPAAAKAMLLEAAAGSTEGDGLEPARLLFALLGALDRYVGQTHEQVVNGVLHAVLFAPFIGRELASGQRHNLDRSIDARMTAVGGVVGLARRDREMGRQILLSHQRLLEPGRRRRAGAAARQNFHDALVFLGLWVDAVGNGRAGLDSWQSLTSGTPTAEPEPRTQRRRRRRSGGRRGGSQAPEGPPGNGGEAHAGES